MKKIFTIIFALGLCCLGVLTYAESQPPNIYVRLVANGEIKPNKTITLHVYIVSRYNLKASLSLDVPRGFSLVSGTPNWRSGLNKEVPEKIEIVVRTNEITEGQITALINTESGEYSDQIKFSNKKVGLVSRLKSSIYNVFMTTVRVFIELDKEDQVVDAGEIFFVKTEIIAKSGARNVRNTTLNIMNSENLELLGKKTITVPEIKPDGRYVYGFFYQALESGMAEILVNLSGYRTIDKKDIVWVKVIGQVKEEEQSSQTSEFAH